VTVDHITNAATIPIGQAIFALPHDVSRVILEAGYRLETSTGSPGAPLMRRELPIFRGN